APLDQLDASIARNQAGVDRVDPLFGERLQHTLDGGGDQEVDVVLRQLALEVELDGRNAAAKQLRMQGRQSLGEARERAQVRELLGRQRWSVDGEAGQVPRQDRSHFFCNVKSH